MRFFNILLLPLLLLSNAIAFISAAPASARIISLPGFNGTLPSKHYSGYVTLDERNGRSLYYYFVESEGDPAKDPVVLWLNGGPGCSSFDGFIYEHGPFNFEVGKSKSMPTLHLNPYSWSKVSSVIYLDSPAGVGLSYSINKSDYETGDLKTAADTHLFLLKWFEQYPEFLSNPFFISGESYAGVYVPTLASEVAKGIEEGLKPILNFKGYMVGNGVTDNEFDGNALVPFAHGMGLISNDLFEEVNATCQGSYWKPINDACKAKLDRVDWELGDLNIYDILEPCYHGPGIRISGNSRLPSSFRRLGETDRPLPVRKRIFGRAWPLRAPVRDGRVPTWPELGSSSNVPCVRTQSATYFLSSVNVAQYEHQYSLVTTGNFLKSTKTLTRDSFYKVHELVNDEVATTWLNNADVRDAIHAQPIQLIGEWELCTSKINFYHDAGTMIGYHKNLTSKGYRSLIFSGDHDMCVPYTGSEAWTRSLGYGIIDEWRPWYSGDQIAGYTQGYDNNLTFLTIKGSGHTVPEYKPAEALAFYSRWLVGEPI